MRQHPVPQNITSYQFRLIGDITLKQFLQLLSGGVVGFIFFSTNLPSIIKWFFIIVSVLIGAGIAFMPIEGRSLDKWLLAFINAIYKPTQFHWKKSPKLPDYLSTTKNPKGSKFSPSPTTKTGSSPKKSTEHGEIIQKQEVGRVNQINKLFSSTPNKSTTTPLPAPTPTQTPVSTIKKSPPPIKAVTPITTPPPSNAHQSVSINTVPVNPIKVTSTKKSGQTNTDPIKPAPTQVAQPKPIEGTIVPPTPPTNETPVPAKLNPDLPFPSLPEKPNTLVGMVFTREGKIIDNAVIEIQDQSHRTVRATKTNKIGQFFLATPLDSGSYFIKTEKPSFSFNTISLQLEDKIYPPLEIRAS